MQGHRLVNSFFLERRLVNSCHILGGNMRTNSKNVFRSFQKIVVGTIWAKKQAQDQAVHMFSRRDMIFVEVRGRTMDCSIVL